MYTYVLQAKLKFSFALFTIQYPTSELILSFPQSLILNWDKVLFQIELVEF